MISVGIIGAGYAGLSIALLLSRHSNLHVSLIDKNSCFMHSIRLHQSVYKSIKSISVDLVSLAKKSGFDFIKQDLTLEDFNHIIESSGEKVQIEKLHLSFDYLVMTTGAKTSPLIAGLENASTLEDIKRFELKKKIEELIHSKKSLDINIIGAGATGVQFLFEIEHFLKKSRTNNKLNLVTLDTGILSDFPITFGSYVHQLAQNKKIGLYYQTQCQQIKKDEIILKRFDDTLKIIPSDLCLVFPGVKPFPQKFQCNQSGQLMVGDVVKDNIFCAGDNSHYDGKGSNNPSAQTAVRKARVVAESIINLENGKNKIKYNYQPLGYFVSLGPGDGIGWMLNKNAVTTGLTAYAIKEMIEKQFDVFLEGLDTYI